MIFLRNLSNPKRKKGLKLNLAWIKGYLLREDFQRFQGNQRPDFAGNFLDNWVTLALKPNWNR
jgi:hypothetical protein